jgi:ectoine hydroxylase-related dioxygenase (phytanoyl-CoA dioxygenase family)
LRVIPGTEALSLQEMSKGGQMEGVMLAGMDQTLADESKAIDLILNPGDVSVHNPNILHGSNANTSERWRNGLTIRYIPTTTRVTQEGIGSQFLMRGDPVPGINQYLPWPRFEEGKHMRFQGAERYS